MLFVAIWYVSIRYEGEGRIAVMRVKKELQFFLHPHNVSKHTKLQHTA